MRWTPRTRRMCIEAKFLGELTSESSLIMILAEIIYLVHLHVEPRLGDGGREQSLCVRLFWGNESLIYIRELQASVGIRWLARYRLVQKMRRMDSSSLFVSPGERAQPPFHPLLLSATVDLVLPSWATNTLCLPYHTFAKPPADAFIRAEDCENESCIRIRRDATLSWEISIFVRTDNFPVDRILLVIIVRLTIISTSSFRFKSFSELYIAILS